MDNDPKRLTSEDIKLLLQPPPNTNTCNDVAFFNAGIKLGECYRCCGQFCKTISYVPLDMLSASDVRRTPLTGRTALKRSEGHAAIVGL